MTTNDLLQKILVEVTNESLKHELIKCLFGISHKREAGIPKLKEHQRSLDNKGTYQRMKTVAGGTGVSVAKLLDVSPQAWNNQKQRNKVSAKSIIGLHLATGVSVDWLLGSWHGSDYEYESMNSHLIPPAVTEMPVKNSLSFVEIYDQQSGNMELKWCLTKRQIAYDQNGMLIPDDLGALLSLIVRYKAEAGTPERVKSARRRHFQVRRVLAYVLGDPKLIRQLDAKAKKLTVEHQSDLVERAGKTEFRLHTASNECLRVLQTLADQHELTMVRPRFDSIAWDYLIGPGSIPPQTWVLEKLEASRVSNSINHTTGR